MNFQKTTAILASVMMLGGCAVPGAGGDGTGDETPSTDPNAPTGECDRIGFVMDMTTERAAFGSKGGREYLSYTVRGAGSGYDKLEFRSYLRADEVDPIPAGEYSFIGEDGKDCEPCLYAYRGCTDDSCDETYIADGGLIAIESSGTVGDPFKANLKDVTFREIGATWQPKTNGKEFCGDQFFWDSEIQNDRLGECVEAGTGTEIGDKLKNTTIKNCYEEPIALHDYCGRVKAQIVMLTAGWCGACEAALPGIEQMHQENRAAGLRVHYHYGEDAQRQKPSFDACEVKARSFNADPAYVLVDNKQGNSFGYTMRDNWGNVYGSPEGVFGLPSFFVLDGNDMSYFFNSSRYAPNTVGSMEQAVNQLLSQ
jgi:thiol-disulfide isomerase/thioredoxin